MIRRIGTTILLVIIAICFVVSTYGFAGGTQNTPPKLSLSQMSISKKLGYDKIPSVSDINISEKLEYQRFGLFYYDGNRSVRVDEDNINIDTTKPMVIYTHGMVYDTGHTFNAGFSDRSIWQNAGYNTFVFRWTSFADDVFPLSIEAKEWSGRDGNMDFAYGGENGKRKVEKIDVPQYSMAEVFAIFYNEFMTKYNVKSPEIRLMGHSMGGQLTMAVASYIKTMIDCGEIDPKNMFSRITMLDPFLSSGKNEIEVPWIEEKVGINGSAGMVIDVAQEFISIGIPIEYISSGLVDTLVMQKYKDLLKKYTSFVRVDSSYLTGDIITVIGSMHQVAVDWYNESYQYGFMDSTVDDLNYAVAASTPTAYTIAQLGGEYAMERNYTAEHGDENIFSTNFFGNAIMGYAFEDENGNGLKDDTYASMRQGVEVELYAEGEKIATTTTNEGGFYKFELGLVYHGKELEIRAMKVVPTILATGEGFLAFTENAINQNGKSEKFVLEHRKQTKIVNIGIK